MEVNIEHEVLLKSCVQSPPHTNPPTRVFARLINKTDYWHLNSCYPAVVPTTNTDRLTIKPNESVLLCGDSGHFWSD